MQVITLICAVLTLQDTPELILYMPIARKSRMYICSHPVLPNTSNSSITVCVVCGIHFDNNNFASICEVCFQLFFATNFTSFANIPNL